MKFGKQIVRVSWKHAAAITLLAGLVGCGSPESDISGHKNAAQLGDPSIVNVASIGTNVSKGTNAINSTFDSVDKQLSQEAQARREAAAKEAEASRKQEAARWAHQSQENDKDRAVKTTDQVVSLASMLILGKAMSNMTSDSDRCRQKGSFGKLLKESNEAIFYRREPAPVVDKKNDQPSLPNESAHPAAAAILGKDLNKDAIPKDKDSQKK
jgi:hypothetical protein